MATLTPGNPDVTYTTLTEIPDLMAEFKGAAKDMLPVIGSSRSAKGNPATAFEVGDITIDRDHLANYCHATGLRLGETLPVTYPYVLSFPIVMKVMSAPDFPFKAVGAVHINNTIEQAREIGFEETLTIKVHATNLRKHRKGLLIDLVTEVYSGAELVWRQVSAFLAMGAKLSSSADKAITEREADNGHIVERGEIPANTVPYTWRVDGGDISRYADASGDRNPIHTSKLGAKAFGFPTRIAHGMWSAARMVSGVEPTVPGAVKFSVEFAKPVILPATLAYYATPKEKGWDLQLRKNSNLDTIHAIGTIEEL